MERPVISLDRRRAGVLLHLTSLPGAGPCGTLGREARNFIDFLATAGLSVWQMLPIGPVGLHGSPYQSSSAHAGDPRFIDLEWLQEREWLLGDWLPPATAVDKRKILYQSWLDFNTYATPSAHDQFQQFIAHRTAWLEDYALFHALHNELAKGWWEWPKPLRDRDPQALAAARKQWATAINVLKYEQFVFFTQWAELLNYAQQRGVLLFGDIPIFVAHDSAEVWANPLDFDLNTDGTTRVVAGVPPDYFSATGQRWGNPLYRWEKMLANDFAFWVQRIHTQLELFDLLRIDHFRGFEAYWEIPAYEPNAVQGRWVQAPGNALFTHLYKIFGRLPLVAEDLGIITPAVEAMRQRYGLPGMRVLQFAFAGGYSNPYLPHNHTPDSVVYTGTHDNDTSLGWYQSLDPDTKAGVDEFFKPYQEPMPWPLIRTAMASVGNLAIIPMQDLLELDGQHRMNLPGTTNGNWEWRFAWDAVPVDLTERTRFLVAHYNRL